MSALGELTLLDPAGESARLGDLVDRPTVLVIPRYYGCLPCRDYLRQVSDRYEELDRIGAGAVAVSVGAGFQAQWLRERYGIRFPLLLDPDRQLYRQLELPRTLSVMVNPRGLLNYARAILRGNRQGLVIAPAQTPGLAILDPEAEPVYVHRGRALGDYPPLDSVIARVEKLGPLPSR